MADPIFGKEVIIEMLDGLNYYPILCGTDCSFSRTPEVINISSPDSGLFTESMVRRESWSMSVAGITKVANDTALTFFYMLQTAIRRTKRTLRITFTDPAGADIQISGDVIIGNESISGPATDFAQGSIEFIGTGPFAIGSVTPPVVGTLNIYSDYWTPGAGNSYIDGSSSGNSPAAVLFGGVFNLGATDTILDVHVEGDHFNIITSGAPGNLECKFDSGLGQIRFASTMLFLGTEKVWVEFQRV